MPESEPRIRAVLFDAVGTLFQSRGTIGEIYRDIAASHGFVADAGEIQRQFDRLIQHGTPTEKTGWHSLVCAVFQNLGPFPQLDAFFEELYAFFESRQGWRCYGETRRVLDTLRQNNYLLGVVSNFDARLGKVLRDLQIDRYFQVVVTPASSGYAKPDSRIFLEATHLLGIARTEALFVGDDPGQDYLAATKAGLRSVLIKRTADPMLTSHACPSLEGVLTLLGIPLVNPD